MCTSSSILQFVLSFIYHCIFCVCYLKLAFWKVNGRKWFVNGKGNGYECFLIHLIRPEHISNLDGHFERPLFPPSSEGSTEMTLACCPLSWISLTLWPWCRSLKSQSRKTPGLICYDGSACHPDGIWRTETSCLDE